MPFQHKLPPELWLAILDIAIGSIIVPNEICNASTFPYVLSRLRTPWDYRPLKLPIAIRDLRLTCQMFNALVKGSSPYFFMLDANVSIPHSAKALYIHSTCDGQTYLQRLLSDPTLPQRIVVLDVAGYEAKNGRQEYACHFDFLCDSAPLLPSVRCLTFSVRHGGFVHNDGRTIQIDSAIVELDPPRFWGRLNDAFPRLTCLVLRGGHSLTEDEESVVFKDLEVLDLDLLCPEPSVYFPSLRHVAFGTVSHIYTTKFTAWRQLESLHIRSKDGWIWFENWGLLPNMRALGIPGDNTLSPLPPNHPLEHIYIYISTLPTITQGDYYLDTPRRKELTWLKSLRDCSPGIKTISYLRSVRYGTHSILHFSDGELGSIGLAVRKGIPQGPGPPRLILDRIPVYITEAKIEVQEPTIQETIAKPSKRKGFRAGWRRLRQFTSGKGDL